MPTYAFKCLTCGAQLDTVMSIREYMAAPPAFFCCSTQMGRFFEVVPAMAITNALASERHYENLRAQDGTPIDTRAKHREYMRANSLTTVDDFSKTWKRDAEARADRLAGADPQRARDIAQAIAKHGG